MLRNIRFYLAICLAGALVFGCKSKQTPTPPAPGNQASRPAHRVVTLTTQDTPVATRPAADPNGPEFRFAVMSDIQYGDKPDDSKYGNRYYRKSLERLKDCVADLNKNMDKQPLTFAIQLGDIIDGRETQDKTLIDLDTVLEAYNEINCLRFHVIGNHCLSAGRRELLDALAVPGYYALSNLKNPRTRGWVFIVLDGNGPEADPFGKTQTAWLEQTLKSASDRKEKAIVFCHYPLVKEAAPSFLANAVPVLKLMEDSHCVMAYFAGHEHGGGYGFHNGIHHVTMRGMVDYPKDGAYGVVEVYGDRLQLVGHGSQASYTMYFNKAAK